MKPAILLVLVLGLSGCSLLRFPELNAPKPPQTTYKYNETFAKNPTAVAIGDKIVVVEAQSRTVTAGYEVVEKPLSFWQRLMNWIGGWSLITIIIVLGSMALGFTGPAVWLLARFNTFKKTTKQLVRGIAEAKAVESNPELKNKLSAMLDNDSKKLIDDIRRE
jgi:hypothetical protein